MIKLEPMLKGLQAGEFIYEQAALGEAEYTFKHVLTQEVAYNSVLMERRRLLHERTGEAIEALFKDRIDDHLAELAHHYSRSANTRKAVDYLFRAGRQARGALRLLRSDHPAFQCLGVPQAVCPTTPNGRARSCQCNPS